MWLFVAGFLPANGGPRFFIFLTNWAILSFNAYLIWSAFSTTLHYLLVHKCCKSRYHDDNFNHGYSEYELEKPQGCCGLKSNGISWYHMIHWLLFALGAEVALAITILYWSLIYDTDQGAPDGVNVNTHLTNGIVALLDIFITGIPISIYHFIYIQLFFTVYAVFTGIYHAADGTNVNGSPFIYGIIDYGSTPGTAAGIVIGVILVYTPIIHLLFYLLYLARYWLVYLVYRPRGLEKHSQLESGKPSPPQDQIEMKENIKSEP